MASTTDGAKVDHVQCKQNGAAEPESNHTVDQRCDSIAYLRWLQALSFVSLGTVLTNVGLTLISIGACWGALQFLRSHPYLMLIFAGLVCLIAGAATNPDGLLISFPAEVQQLLLHGTVFDLVHDYSGTSNFCRRWGRVLMLCSTTSEDAVAAITGGMDPEFVNMVFKKSFIEFFPLSVSRLLLPEHQEPPPLLEVEEGAENEDVRPKSAMAKWCHAMDAVQVANRLHRVKKPHHSEGSRPEIEHISPTQLTRMIIERKEEVEARIVEPSLNSLLVSLCKFTVLKRSLTRSLLLRGLKALRLGAAIATAYWWGSTAALVTSPAAQNFFLRGISSLAISRGHSRDFLLRRGSFATLMLGSLSAGFGLAAISYSRRIDRLLPPPSSHTSGPN